MRDKIEISNKFESFVSFSLFQNKRTKSKMTIILGFRAKGFRLVEIQGATARNAWTTKQ